MWNFITEIWKRVVKNWATSSIAIIAAAALIASRFGFETNVEEISIVIIGIQSLVLLFAKD